MRFTADLMAMIAGEYQTLTTITTISGGGLQPLLPQNPKRFYVRFDGFAGFSTNPKVYPSPKPSNIVATVNASGLQEWKFLDAPSLVTGEFYGFDDGTTQWTITECIYVGP